MQKVAVLRWGHRFRDERLTTHVALTARAFGVSEFVLADVKDEEIRATIEKTVRQWGGTFDFKMGVSWKDVVREWKTKNGVIIHLTMYGENIQTSDVLQRIKATGKDILVIVGSQKVPSEFFSEKVSDFNVAIGNQPHSEVAALAVFLDRLYQGKELTRVYENAKLHLTPSIRGKNIIETQRDDKNDL